MHTAALQVREECDSAITRSQARWLVPTSIHQYLRTHWSPRFVPLPCAVLCNTRVTSLRVAPSPRCTAATLQAQSAELIRREEALVQKVTAHARAHVTGVRTNAPLHMRNHACSRPMGIRVRALRAGPAAGSGARGGAAGAVQAHRAAAARRASAHARAHARARAGADSTGGL